MVTIVLTVLLFVWNTHSTDLARVQRHVYSNVSFRGAPLLDDISNDVTLDFLNYDQRLPRRFFSARWCTAYPNRGHLVFRA